MDAWMHKSDEELTLEDYEQKLRYAINIANGGQAAVRQFTEALKENVASAEVIIRHGQVVLKNCEAAVAANQAAIEMMTDVADKARAVLEAQRLVAQLAAKKARE